MSRSAIAWILGVTLAASAPPAGAARPLPPVEKLVTDFETADKAHNNGKGDSESPDSSSLGWGESGWLRNYWEVYELTGQTRWWDKIIDHFDRMIAHLTDHDGDGFKSWQTKRYSTALIRAEALHNRGTAAIQVPTPKLFDGKKAAQVADRRYLVEFLDARTFRLRNAATLKVLTDKVSYKSGQAITIAPNVQVTITGKPEQGDTFSIWTTAPRPIEYVVHQGMVLKPVAWFIEAALKRPSGDAYHKKAKDYLAVIEKHFLLGNEKYWTDTGDGAGAYRFTPEPTERYPNRILPHNQYLALARAWLILADATGNDLYRRRAEAMAKNFKRALRDVDGAYEWDYWDWIENGKPDSSRAEDSSHGTIDVGFVIEAARRGVVFTDGDARCLAKTMTSRMWNGSTDAPRFGDRVDTNVGDRLPLVDWVDLGKWDPRIFDLLTAALMAGPETPDRAWRIITLLNARKRAKR
ncbi:MAG: AGE family epimerase/isomerase [Phycisphaerae bacterium]|nr:AGE family epimerase/isomerase [Phycisphaerae bacterium]